MRRLAVWVVAVVALVAGCTSAKPLMPGALQQLWSATELRDFPRPTVAQDACIVSALRTARPSATSAELSRFIETEPRWRDPYLSSEIAKAYTGCLGPTAVARAVLPSNTPVSSSCAVIGAESASAIYLSALLADERRLFESASSVSDCARDEALAGTEDGLVIASMRTAGLASLASTEFAQCMAAKLAAGATSDLESAMRKIAKRSFTPDAERATVSDQIVSCSDGTALAQLLAATAEVSPVCAAQLVSSPEGPELTALIGAYLSADTESGAVAVAAVQARCAAQISK